MTDPDGIVPLERLGAVQRHQAAELLLDGFAHAPSAWRTIEEATAEIASFLPPQAEAERRRAWAAVDEGAVVGLIGAIAESDHLWELHPLVVTPARQRGGVGSRLVRVLEDEARAAGVTTVMLGSDDDFGGTSLFGRDLYPDVLGALAGLEVTGGHPLAFYRRHGYAVVGVIPDSTGPGRHDIIMAKRVGS